MAKELRLETWSITTTCRANKGAEAAWEEAVANLREVYNAQVRYRPDVTLNLSIGRVLDAPA